MHRFIDVLILLILAGGLPAQFHSGDLVGAGSDGRLFRCDAAGNFATFTVGYGPLTGWTMDYDNTSMLVTDPVARNLYLVDGSLSIIRVYPFPSFIPMDVAVDQNGDLLFTDALFQGIRRFAFSGGIFPVAGGLSPDLFGGLVIDIDSSDLLLTRGSGVLDGNPVFQVSRNGSTVTSTRGGVTGCHGMTQTPDGVVYVASCAGTPASPRLLYRLSPGAVDATPFLTTLPETGITGITAVKADRGSAPSQRLLLAAHDRKGMWFLDVESTTVTRVNTLQESLYEVGFLGSRNVGSALVAPRKWALNVSFPGEAGNGYHVVMGFSGVRPALTLPDGRRLHLVPDALTMATLSGPIPPFFTGNIGTLDSRGMAFPVIDLTTLPRAADGILVWIVAATFQAEASMGMATLSDPMVFRIE